MKIVFLSKTIIAEGSSIQQLYLAKNLIELGNEVFLLTGKSSIIDEKTEGVIKKFQEEGVKIYYLPFSVDIVNKKTIIKILFKYIYALPKALKILNSIKPDVIHCHYPVTSYIAAIYRKVSKTKFVSTFHIEGIPKHPLNRKADKVIAISSELKIDLKKRYSYDDSQIELIYNGVPEQIESNNFNVREKYKIEADETIILSVGSLIERKGIDVTLNALGLLEKGLKYKLLILGDGEIHYKNQLLSLAKELGIEKNIIFCGWQNPYDYYKESDIFVLSSRIEGFPLVVVEAMINGTCSVRSNSTGAYDQIENKVTGFIFENENYKELSEILDFLIQDENLRKKIGEKGKEKALKQFTDKVNAIKTLEVYESLVKNEEVEKNVQKIF